MNFDEFVKKLDQRLNSVLFKEDENGHLGTTAVGFNQGARTMYNYALVAAYEIQSEMQKEAC